MDYDEASTIVIERARAAGIPVERRKAFSYSASSGVKEVLELSLPNGRDKRAAIATEESIQVYLNSNFEHYTILGNYLAFLDKSTCTIKALIRGTNTPITGPSMRRLAQRAAASRNSNSDIPVSDEDPIVNAMDIEDEAVTISEPTDWELEITTPNPAIELKLSKHDADLYIAAADPHFGRYRSADNVGPCLKIYGVSSIHHDDALALLEKYSTALFFELDLRHNISFRLARARPTPSPTSSQRRPDHNIIRSVSNLYAPEAVAMYSYGRSATGMPLLQFLAYYQAVEFFFPSFSNAAILHRLRLHLKDPRFDKDNDSELQRIVSISRGSIRGAMSEKEQLRATLEGSLEEDDLREFVSHHPNLATPEKGKAIRGVSNLKSKSSDRMIDQVADRIYKIRCRIVHTKDVGGESGVDVLLPFGSEAEALREDIALMRYVAQKVIIAGSRGSL